MPGFHGTVVERSASSDVQLGLHQIEIRRHFRDRMLHLQPRVDLEEGEQVFLGLVQELDGARPFVTDRKSQALGRRLHLRDPLVGEQRRR